MIVGDGAYPCYADLNTTVAYTNNFENGLAGCIAIDGQIPVVATEDDFTDFLEYL